MRRQLEGMFRTLNLVHDEIGVASEAARSEGQSEITNVLSLSVCNRVFGQLRLLTNIIKRLSPRKTRMCFRAHRLQVIPTE